MCMYCRPQSTSESEKSRPRTSSTAELKRRLSRQLSRQKSIEEEKMLKKTAEMSQLVQEEKAESGHVCEIFLQSPYRIL